MELEPEPELFKSRNRNHNFFISRNRNRNQNFSKVGTGTGTVKNSYGSTTLFSIAQNALETLAVVLPFHNLYFICIALGLDPDPAPDQEWPGK